MSVPAALATAVATLPAAFTVAVAGALVALGPRIVECSHSPAAADAVLEIEARLGSVLDDGLGFQSGVSQRTFVHLNEALCADVRQTAGGVTVRHSVTQDAFASSGVRYTFEVDTQRSALSPHPAAAVRKERVCDAVVGGTFRLAVSLEHAVDLEAEPYDPAAIVRSRRKERTTFDYGALRIDLTHVVTARVNDGGAGVGFGVGCDAGAAPRSAYECEIEFECPRGRGMSPAAVQRLAPHMQALCDRLLALLESDRAAARAHEAAPSRDALLLSAPFIRRLGNDDTLAVHVRARCWALWEAADPERHRRPVRRGRNRRFGGVMPLALRRAHLRSLVEQRDRYYVSDKPDGVRLQMYGAGALGVFFVDRMVNIYAVAASSYLRVYARPEFLLDGELVQNSKTQRHAFLVFDIYALDNEDFSMRFLSERLQVRFTRLPHCR